MVHPDSHELVKRLRSGKPPEYAEAPLVEEKFVKRDGSVIYVEVAGIPITYQDQLASQIMIRDITDRKRADASLRERNAYLAPLHETSLAIMDRLDLRESLEAIAAWSGALLGTEHGYIYLVDPEREELVVEVAIGAFKDWAGFRMKRGEGIAGKVWDTGQALVVEDYDTWEGRSPNFQKGVFRAALGVPLKSAQGVVGVLGLAHIEEGRTFSEAEVELLTQFAALASVALGNARLYTDLQRELSERRRFEHELGQREAKYRTLVERIPAITYTAEFGEQGRWLFVSPQIEAILGFTPQEWMAAPDIWRRQLHPDDVARILQLEERSRRTLEPIPCEYRLFARNGRTVWVLGEAVVVRDERGEPRFSQGILYDITSRKKAEEDLERALSIEREASERLRALHEMKNKFLHAVSHELRTPLSDLLGLALTLEREEVHLPGEERQDLVRRLAANARKLDQLLSDLLDLDRLDRGIMEPRRRPTGRGGAGSADRGEPFGQRGASHSAGHDDMGPGSPRSMAASLSVSRTTGRESPRCSGSPSSSPSARAPDAPSHSHGVGIGLSLVAKFTELHGGRASCKVFLPGAAA